MADPTEEILETVHMTMPHVHGGNPLYEHYDYAVTPDFAQLLYKRKLARPAAEFYLEALAALGVTGCAIADDAQPSLGRVLRRPGFPVKLLKEG